MWKIHRRFSWWQRSAECSVWLLKVSSPADLLYNIWILLRLIANVAAQVILQSVRYGTIKLYFSVKRHIVGWGLRFTGKIMDINKHWQECCLGIWLHGSGRLYHFYSASFGVKLIENQSHATGALCIHYARFVRLPRAKEEGDIYNWSAYEKKATCSTLDDYTLKTWSVPHECKQPTPPDKFDQVRLEEWIIHSVSW